MQQGLWSTNSGGLVFLSVAECVVNRQPTCFIMAIKFRRYNKAALFSTKRAVIVELLGGFEPPTSSLPKANDKNIKKL